MNEHRLIKHIAAYSTAQVVGIGSAIILINSIILVYFVTGLFNEEYTLFLFLLSSILPMLLSPVSLYFSVKISHKLVHTQQHLQEEIARRQEQELILFEKTRFIQMGEMMANISHQWRQPLNTINLAIINLKLQHEWQEEEIKSLDVIEQNTTFLADTINHFSSFFDQRSPQEMKSFSQILAELKSIVAITFKNDFVDLIIENKLPTNTTLAASIMQVILNLLNNAKDACQEQKVKEVKLVAAIENEVVVIRCYDSGSGISEENKEKIFMPYFTTKPVQSGSGLGLYMSRTIIEKIFNGEIELQKQEASEMNSYNTCVVVKIPHSHMCQF